LILYTGAADIGQGSDTILCQIAAEYFALPLERIQLVRGDTARTTSAGATSASRQTYISGNAVLAAAQNIEGLLVQEAAVQFGVHPSELRREGLMIVARDGRTLDLFKMAACYAVQGKEFKAEGRFDPLVTRVDHTTGQGIPYASYAFAAQTAWTEIDRHSGLVRVPRVAAAHDVGRAINPRAVYGQICGGVVMGLGFAAMEEFIPGKTENFREYHMPTMADAPRITPLLVEDEESTGPFGAKGVGEPALIPTAPAVAGGVSAALGKPMTKLPLSLETVMEGMAKR
jgi:CO/xanthine dehydrogenase Mo-binding subunit